MVTFLVLAGVLIIAGVALVVVPLLRRMDGDINKAGNGGSGGLRMDGELRTDTDINQAGVVGRGAGNTQLAPATWTALVAAAVLVIGSAVMYATLTNWSWHAAPAADSAQTMVAQLARKLERDPKDLNGWLMLGRSYVVLEQFPLALRAFERADRLAGGQSAEALVGEAEALTMNDENELSGRAGKLIEQALLLDPNSGKALFFGAAAAVRRGELALGKERFQKLLAQNPPEAIRPILQQQIDALEQRLAGNDNPTVKGGGAAPTQAAATNGAGVAGTQAAGAKGAAVRVHIEVAPKLAPADAAAPLFVFVRDPAQPGPPLAAKRLAARFPQTVELTPSDSMVPGRSFAAGQKVQVVARIARSGNPMAGSGDPFGEAPYDVGHDGLVNIVIDHVTP